MNFLKGELMGVIKERCAEESDSFMDSIIEIIQNFNNPKFDFERAKDIASAKARNISKCIIRSE